MPSSSRVSVFNLDAVEQARLWKRYGPAEATRMLVAAIRAALLMGEKVHSCSTASYSLPWRRTGSRGTGLERGTS